MQKEKRASASTPGNLQPTQATSGPVQPQKNTRGTLRTTDGGACSGGGLTRNNTRPNAANLSAAGTAWGVAPRARRYGAGRAIVDAVAERLKTDASWRAWREFVSDEDDYLYARVVDERGIDTERSGFFEPVSIAEILSRRKDRFAGCGF